MHRSPGSPLSGIMIFLALAGAVQAQVSFSQSFGPDAIGPGSASRLTYTITNGSGAPLTDLAFTNVLPSGVTIADPPVVEASFKRDALLSAPAGGSTISLSDGFMGDGATATISLLVTAATPGTYMNLTGDLTSSAGNHGTATAELTVDTARPGISLSVSPSPVAFGGRATLTFVIDNTANSGAIFSPSFLLRLPLGVSVARPSRAMTDCTGGTVTAEPGSQQINFSALTVSAGSSCTASVDVLGLRTGSQPLFVELRFSDQFSLSFSAGLGAASITADPKSDLFLAIRPPEPVAPGGTARLNVEITNPVAADVTDLEFSLDLGAVLPGLSALGLPMADVCGAGSMLSSSANVLSFTGGNLASGASCSFSVDLQVPAGATPGDYLFSSTLGTSGQTFPSSAALLIVSNAPILTLDYVDDPAGPGGTVTLDFTVMNVDPAFDATDLTLTLDLTPTFPVSTGVTTIPQAGDFGPASTFGFTESNPPAPQDAEATFTLAGGSLGQGATDSFELTQVLPVGLPPGTYTVRTEVRGTIDGVEVMSNPASAELVVLSGPELAMEFSDDPVAPGGTVTLEYTVKHPGAEEGNTATNVAFSHDLGATLAGLTFDSLLQNDCGGTLSGVGTGMVSLSGGTLLAGEQCTIRVLLSVPAQAPSGNQTSATSTITAEVNGLTTINAAASAELKFAGLVVTHEFLDDPATAGTTTTLRYTLENTSTQDMTSVTFSHDLDAVIDSLEATAGLGSVCNGTLTGISGNTFLFLTGASLLAGETCSFDVTVSIPAATGMDQFRSVTSAVTATVGGSITSFDPSSAVLNLNVEPEQEIAVELDGNDLVIRGDDNDNIPRISIVGADLVIFEPNIALGTLIGGASGSGTNTLTVPLSAFSGNLRFEGGNGDDVLTLDFGSGNFPAIVVVVDGGDNGSGGDRLALDGGSFPNLKHTATGKGSGIIELGGTTIEYSNLE